MLLHIRPRILLARPIAPVALIDLRLEPFGLTLHGGIDLAARRPYSNKLYYVGCRKAGRAAVDGLLIETARPVSGWSYVARWAMAAERLVTHRVTVELLNTEDDAATESMMLWPRHLIPSYLEGMQAAKVEPKMLDDAPGGILNEVFRIPTVSRSAILGAQKEWPLPNLANAFLVP